MLNANVLGEDYFHKPVRGEGCCILGRIADQLQECKFVTVQK